MDLAELRKYRLDLENFPYYNDRNIGIALFDVVTAFLGAYILDNLFNLSKYIPVCKNKRTVYYLLVIPFGILTHHILAHINSFQRGERFIFPEEMTFLNKKLFSLTPNIYHGLLILLVLYTVNVCKK